MSIALTCGSLRQASPLTPSEQRNDAAWNLAWGVYRTAEESPGDVALRVENQTLTYGELRASAPEPIIKGRNFDIRFRMLEPKELARAMGFSDAETAYELAGNKNEITTECRISGP